MDTDSNNQNEDLKNQKQKEYEVGYKKPPKHTRFKKGQRANPKGRPKKILDDGRGLIQELLTEVEINENGKKKKITLQKTIDKRLVNSAAAGNLKAMSIIDKRLEKIVPVLEKEEYERKQREEMEQSIIENQKPNKLVQDLISVRLYHMEGIYNEKKVKDEIARLLGLHFKLYD